MSLTTLRAICSISTQADVVTSPPTNTMPVFTKVSQATRAWRSCSKIASSTASDIWSAILSGWPSETDSEVNKKSVCIDPFLILSNNKNQLLIILGFCLAGNIKLYSSDESKQIHDFQQEFWLV